MKLGRVPVAAAHEDSQGVQVVESGEWRQWRQHMKTQLGKAKPTAHKLARKSPAGCTQRWLGSPGSGKWRHR